MGTILILDNKVNRREILIRGLHESGYTACGISDRDYSERCIYSNYDLVIVNLYPDARRSWEFYLRFKKKWPALPVLVYLGEGSREFKMLEHVLASIFSGLSRSGNALDRPENDFESTYYRDDHFQPDSQNTGW